MTQRILAQLPGELAVADIDRVDLRRAFAQEHVGEAAGRGHRYRAPLASSSHRARNARAHAPASCRRATCPGMVAAAQLKRQIVGEGRAGLVELFVAAPDRRRRGSAPAPWRASRPARSLDQQHIQTLLLARHATAPFAPSFSKDPAPGAARMRSSIVAVMGPMLLLALWGRCRPKRRRSIARTRRHRSADWSATTRCCAPADGHEERRGLRPRRAFTANLDPGHPLRAEEWAWISIVEILPYNWTPSSAHRSTKQKIAATPIGGAAIARDQAPATGASCNRAPSPARPLANSCLVLPGYHPGGRLRRVNAGQADPRRPDSCATSSRRLRQGRPAAGRGRGLRSPSRARQSVRAVAAGRSAIATAKPLAYDAPARSRFAGRTVSDRRWRRLMRERSGRRLYALPLSASARRDEIDTTKPGFTRICGSACCRASPSARILRPTIRR